MSDTANRKAQAERIIRQYADMIFRIAYQNLGSRTDAEDIFQEVCMALLTKNAPLFDDGHIRPWLVRVTLNKCKNWRSAAERRLTEPLDDHLDLYAPEDESVLSEVMSLPVKYRNVIYLYYYEGYSLREIGELLSVSVNTAGTWLRRARKRLRLLLEE